MDSPFTPGVGLEPPYLAGRTSYINDYSKRLQNSHPQQMNSLIVGLRGVGKSVLVKTLAKNALENNWVPVIRELSKRSNNEDELINGVLADVALRMKGVTISRERKAIGLGTTDKSAEEIDLIHLIKFFQNQPGDKGDKLRLTLEYAANICVGIGFKGLALLLDEFQLLNDQDGQYSLSLVLDAVSKTQASTTIPIHAVFAGLPTMQNKMVESKPHVERLFSNVINLGPLSREEALDAIRKPLATIKRTQHFTDDLVEFIAEISEGYPFFVQYFAHEAFTNFQHSPIKKSDFEIILPEINAKLDEHFFIPRFLSTSNKERAVTLTTIELKAPFTPSELLETVRKLGGNVTMGTIQQYLLVLQEKNILYKVRRGSYDYALPLFASFLKRCVDKGENPRSVIESLGQI